MPPMNTSSGPHPGTLSVQLYTFWRELEQPGGLETVLTRLMQIGFQYVEPFDLGSHEKSNADKLAHARELREALDRHGLRASSAHVAAPVGPDADAVLDALQTVGTDFGIVAWPGGVPGFSAETFGNRGELARFTDAMNEAAAQAARRGVTLGYHNHAWEWNRLPDGEAAYTLFLRQLDPAVALQIDTYWARTAGLDVPALLRELGPRVRSLHLKDGPAQQDADQVPLGGGVVDYAGAIQVAPGVRWHVLEMDRTAGDVFADIQQSAGQLISEGWSQWK